MCEALPAPAQGGGDAQGREQHTWVAGHPSHPKPQHHVSRSCKGSPSGCPPLAAFVDPPSAALTQRAGSQPAHPQAEGPLPKRAHTRKYQPASSFRLHGAPPPPPPGRPPLVHTLRSRTLVPGSGHTPLSARPRLVPRPLPLGTPHNTPPADRPDNAERRGHVPRPPGGGTCRE